MLFLVLVILRLSLTCVVFYNNQWRISHHRYYRGAVGRHLYRGAYFIYVTVACFTQMAPKIVYFLENFE